MQARISSPPRVDEDEFCVAIYELCIVQIVLSHNLQTTIFHPSANFVVIYRAVSPQVSTKIREKRNLHICLHTWKAENYVCFISLAFVAG